MPAISRSAVLLACPLFCLSAAGCVEISAGDVRYIDTIEKRFTVAAVPTLRLGTFDGSVEVSTWDKPEVFVTIERHARDKASADRMQVTAEQVGDQIKVDVRDAAPDRGLHLTFGSFSASLRVMVPTRTHVEASTGDGRVEIRDVEGTLDVRTGDGSIQLEHVTGDVTASSGDGSIEIDGVMRNLTARSGDGRVRVHAVGTEPIADWRLSTGDGSVVIEVPEGFGADLDASTGDGRVAVHDLPFSGSSSRENRRAAHGRIGSGGGRVSVHSGDGSITIRGDRQDIADR